MGYEATNCNTCHQSENNDFSGVPGAPEWSLAPHSMRWEGLSRVEIAQSMLDPARNGGRSHEDVMHHLTEHELVLWAWTPGINANGTQEALENKLSEVFEFIMKKYISNSETRYRLKDNVAKYCTLVCCQWFE